MSYTPPLWFAPDWLAPIFQVLILAVAFAWFCAPALRRCPIPFYVVVAVLSLGQYASDALAAYPVLASLFKVGGSYYTGISLYLVVMFAGVFDPRGAVGKRLLSVRSELSILAGFPIAVHCTRVIQLIPMTAAGGSSMLGSASALTFFGNVVCGSILLVTFLVGWVTSFPPVRRQFPHRTWKRLQRISYLFMAALVGQGIALNLWHAAFFDFMGYAWLMPDVMTRYHSAAVFYAVIGVVYLVMRIRRFRLKRKRKTGSEA